MDRTELYFVVTWTIVAIPTLYFISARYRSRVLMRTGHLLACVRAVSIVRSHALSFADKSLAEQWSELPYSETTGMVAFFYKFHRTELGWRHIVEVCHGEGTLFRSAQMFRMIVMICRYALRWDRYPVTIAHARRSFFTITTDMSETEHHAYLASDIRIPDQAVVECVKMICNSDLFAPCRGRRWSLTLAPGQGVPPESVMGTESDRDSSVRHEHCPQFVKDESTRFGPIVELKLQESGKQPESQSRSGGWVKRMGRNYPLEAFTVNVAAVATLLIGGCTMDFRVPSWVLWGTYGLLTSAYLALQALTRGKHKWSRLVVTMAVVWAGFAICWWLKHLADGMFHRGY